MMRALELCAGAGGQALGLDNANIEHVGLIEIDKDACQTLSKNRPHWNVINEDLKKIDAGSFKKVDIICGGVPCQPFSIAGQKHGPNDSRDLFPEALRFVRVLKPIGFFFENVRGFADKKFNDYRTWLINEFIDLGYYVEWKVIESADYEVPQLRPRFIMVGKRNGVKDFPWPTPKRRLVTVANTIDDLLNENGWNGLKEWKLKANKIAPTIVGGSKKHGGPDLGPTRAKRQWAELGVDGHGIANEAPDKNFEGNPKLTNKMVARIQGFPDVWEFVGKKTSVYRQIGNAFPPPAAEAIANSFIDWIQYNTNIKPVYEPVQATMF
ncbi:MAG: DNA cytosine methyltransferase [bacterium]|nr:DNA cytosine methyltransferase [bacterium]